MSHTAVGARKMLALAGGVALCAALAVPALSQTGDKSSEMSQKLAGLKQSAADNKARLQHYQWMETQRVVYKGETKKTTENLCSYGADGKVQKIPVAMPDSGQAQSQAGGGGRGNGKFKQRIKEKKTEETMDYMQQVKSLLSLYVPPSADRIQRAIKAGNASIDKGMGTSSMQVAFKNYAQPGDQMTISFDTGSKKITHVDVNTYMDNPKDVVSLSVQMASLPDGTNYTQESVLDATAKQLQVTTTNSNYKKLSN